jgi:hypothetical protein
LLGDLLGDLLGMETRGWGLCTPCKICIALLTLFVVAVLPAREFITIARPLDLLV